jgi:hypothetical protein
MILIYLVFIFLQIYTAIVFLIVLIQLLRKKKLPWGLILIEAICLIVFFYFKYLLDEHKLIFTGYYNSEPEHWESGLANLYVYLSNLLILIGIFSITQIVFWILYLKGVRRLHSKIDLNSLIDSLGSDAKN